MQKRHGHSNPKIGTASERHPYLGWTTRTCVAAMFGRQSPMLLRAFIVCSRAEAIFGCAPSNSAIDRLANGPGDAAVSSRGVDPLHLGVGPSSRLAAGQQALDIGLQVEQLRPARFVHRPPAALTGQFTVEFFEQRAQAGGFFVHDGHPIYVRRCTARDRKKRRPRIYRRAFFSPACRTKISPPAPLAFLTR